MFYNKGLPDSEHHQHPSSSVLKFNLVHTWSLTPTYPGWFTVLESYVVPQHPAGGIQPTGCWSSLHSPDHALSTASPQVQQLWAAFASGLMHGYFYQGCELRAPWGLKHRVIVPFWGLSCSLPCNTTQKYGPGSHVQTHASGPHWT